MTEKIQIPQHMLQQLLRGPTPAQKPPEVVEVKILTEYGESGRLAFNIDSIEKVYETTSGPQIDHEHCVATLKGDKEVFVIDMPYEKFLQAIDVKPRRLWEEE